MAISFQRTLILLLAATLFMGCGDVTTSGDRNAAPIGEPVGVAQTVRFTVDGMGCEACPPQVRKAIAKLPGIDEADVDVDLEAGTCEVRLQPGDPAVEAIVASVEGTQFSLTAN